MECRKPKKFIIFHMYNFPLFGMIMSGDYAMFLILLCSNYQVIFQKLSGHDVCIEIIESLSSKCKVILQKF